MSSSKVPGWGAAPAPRTPDGRDGRRDPELFIDHPNHEALLWSGLRELARFRGRVIYAPIPTCNPPTP